jgi:hypothetical protein
MKPEHKILKFKKIFFYIFLSLILIPYFLLNLTDWWVTRLIAAPLFWLFASFSSLCLAFAPLDYWLSPRNGWKIPKAMGLSRAIAFFVGFSLLILICFTYFRGLTRFILDGGKLQKVTGVIERIEVQYPLSILEVNFKIEGRKSEINLCYPKIRIAKRFPVGTKVDFYLLPGTDYAMDVRLVSSESTP